MPVTVLTDNGSIRDASFLNLKQLAEATTAASGEQVYPLPLQHSEKIPAVDLGGTPAPVFDEEMRRWLEAGERRFQFLPFFIGPTLAITVYLKQLLRGYAKEYGPLEARVAPFLFNGAGAGDRFIAEILRDQVRAVIAENALARPKVALVDHGTPVAGVNYVRNFVAGQLSVLLGDEVSEVSACSMERREGKRYAFNDPLLEDKLREPNYMAGSVVLAMLFLNPGKHAGPGGDVAQIVEEAIASGEVNPELKVYQSPLLGEHPRMVELLSRRLEQLREMPWMEFTGDNNASESRAAEESAASAS